MVQMRVESLKKYKVNEETVRVIEKDDSASSITTDCDDGKPYPVPCYRSLQIFMEWPRVQVFLLTLVIFCVMDILLGLLIETYTVHLDDVDKSVFGLVFNYASLALMAWFNVELILRVFALRLEFFKRGWEMFDAAVVVAAFSLSVSFHAYYRFQTGVGLIVMARFWRIRDICNYVLERTTANLNRQIRHERRRKEAVERELNKYRLYSTQQDKEITFLQGLLRKHGISFSTVEHPVVVETISVVVEMNKACMDG